MYIHYLQHVQFENIGSMETYFTARGDKLSHTRLYKDESFPGLDEFQGLIVMGGPMGVYDELPWLEREKVFIKEAIQAGKKVLGICLGAQLIADVLGADVYKNKYREIGWFPIKKTDQADQTIFKDVFSESMDVFHWHGDTFDIPENAVPLASSKACANQGFLVDDRVAGFQFHLETTVESAKALVENCGNELDGSEFVQTEQEILASDSRFVGINKIMISVLEKLF